MSETTAANKLSVMSLILAIVALVTSWALIGIGFGIAAVATGSVARLRVSRGTATGAGVALAGIVLGIVSLVLGFAALYLSLTQRH